MTADHHKWEPLTITEVCQLFSDLSILWWMAGGTAIDLFVGRNIREHGDIDILIRRKEQLVIQEYLSDWDLHKTSQPGLKPWPLGEYLELDVNQLWCRRTPESPWVLEVMFMDTEDDKWVYRRAPSVVGELVSLGRRTLEGIPYLSPEIQLLYKARETPLPKDEQDFNAALPLLSQSQKNWLASVLKEQFPEGYLWIQRLVAVEARQ